MWLADTGGGASITSWAPLMVAGGGLTVAFITGFTRRDQRVVSQETTLDARTNTALKALSESLNRSEHERERCQVEIVEVEKERDVWRDRAIAAETRADALSERVEVVERQLRSIKERRSRRDD
jgi:septal ring factor EnvC (AmiA/AmiB activator)